MFGETGAHTAHARSSSSKNMGSDVGPWAGNEN